MAYTAIDNSELYFQTKKYAGNDTDDTAITFDNTDTNMQPDLIWEKRIDNGTGAAPLFDSVRGVTKYVKSNTNDAEATASGVKSFDSNGFTLGTAFNYSSTNHCAWCWKAGTSFTNDTSSTGVGSIDSSGSFNNDSGVSIVTYTGTGSNGTIKHGLSSAPHVVFCKQRNETQKWIVYNKALGAANTLHLDTTEQLQDNSAFNDTDPTTSVFSVGTIVNSNKSSGTYVAYCFAPKQGFSKFGTYVGNGNADGPFIYTGFRPAFFLHTSLAGTSGEDWRITDNKRDLFNPVDRTLKPNLTAAEADADVMDFCSNGVKIRSTDGGVNYNGRTNLYWAFAESPFVNSNGVPNNAR